MPAGAAGQDAQASAPSSPHRHPHSGVAAALAHGGYVLVDKPVGPSSFSCVQATRRALGVAGGRRGPRMGHAGTLDPFATGLLVVLLGPATRLMPWVVGHDKGYRLLVRLGVTSDTDDATGSLAAGDTARLPADAAAVQAALDELVARTEQLPPAVSAIKVDGVRSYARARRGEQVELAPRQVRVLEAQLHGMQPGPQPATVDVDLEVACTSGTYMRSLARDLGELLGCGGHAAALRRTRVGEWHVDEARPPDALTGDDVRPAVGLVAHLPHQVLPGPAEARAFGHGQRLPLVCTAQAPAGEAPRAAGVAVLDEAGALLGIGESEPASSGDGHVLRPRCVLVPTQGSGASAGPAVDAAAPRGARR